MKKIAVCLAIFGFLSDFCIAGTTGKISGTVKDSETGEGLPSVNVVIQGTTLGASTNLDGSYYILNIPPGEYDVKATMIGYTSVIQQDVLVKVDLTTQVDYKLSTTVVDLGEEVTVVAERPIVQKDVTSGRAIITSEEIKEMPVETFSDVLKTKAGITEDAGGAMHIRGGRSNEIAYMIDGISVSNPFWGGLAVAVENTAIQELQVVSGTFNAEYGQAMSGVVNIVTKDGGSKYVGNVDFYLGDRVSNHDDVFLNIKDIDPLSLYQADGSLSGPIPFAGSKFTFFVSGRLLDSKGWLFGRRQHNPWDVMYIDSTSVANLARSPYNAEPWIDLNGNGTWDNGNFPIEGTSWIINDGEPFNDRNGNGERDDDEEFVDANWNTQNDSQNLETGSWNSESGEPFFDRDGNGTWNSRRLNFIEPYDDLNHNGTYDLGEPFMDYNYDGARNDGTSGDNTLVPMNPYQKLSLQGKLTYKFSPSMVLRYGFLYDDIESQGYSHSFKYNPDGRPFNYSDAFSHTLDWTHSISASTFYTLKLNTYTNKSKTYLYKDWRDSRYLPNILTTTPGSEFYGGGQSKSLTFRDSKSYVLRFDLTSQVNKTHQVKTGIEARSHQLSYLSYYVDIRDTYDWVPTIHTPETSTGHDRYDDRNPFEFAAYAQDKIELRDMIVNFGLRFDYFNSNWKILKDNSDTRVIASLRDLYGQPEFVSAKEKMQLSPRLGIAYPITERGTIHFSYGHFFQIPPFAYLYSNPEFEVVTGNFRTVLGNADLNPQSTVTYEIGLQQQLMTDVGVELICYYKDINDLLGTEYFETGSGDRYARYANQDYGNVQGVTLSLEKRRGGGWLSATLDYTYQIAEANSSDPLSRFYDLQVYPPIEPIRRVVPTSWDQTHTLNFNITLSKPRSWGISLLGRLYSGLPYTPQYQGVQQDIENSERKPYQATFDLHLHKDFTVGKLRLAALLKVYNLFDRKNEDYVYSDTGRATYSLIPTYTTDHGDEFGRHYLNDYLTRPTYYSAPRQVRLGLSIGF